MTVIRGKGVSQGIAVGPIRFFRRRTAAAAKTAADPDREALRLEAARSAAVRQLEELAETCRQESEEAAALFETHAMLVEDEDFVACIAGVLERERCNAEYAVELAGAQFAAMFERMDDPYMRQRAVDIRDVAQCLLNHLTGGRLETRFPEEPAILCADEFTPSETVGLDRNNLLALVCREGSELSHAAILARTMGIPAVCAVGDVLSGDWEGHEACVDALTGEVILDPDGEVLAQFRAKQALYQGQQRQLEQLREQEDVTPDGKSLRICCNIASPDDVDAVLRCGGRGIGLFRSEFLYLGRSDYPSEEEQFEAYRTVAQSMDGKRVVIRTLDIGADKTADYFNLKQEENPALGLRGVRLCLERPGMFRTQLRAIFRAAAYGRVAVMFPMITSLREVRACKEICREVMAELEREGVPCGRDPEIGIMIETPAAVLMAGELAREVDFFSVGTNDLTQYTLACDRQDGTLEDFFDPRHPAVLRSLKLAADAAHGAGIPICICGELGSDADLLPLFLELGIDEVSVSPDRVLPLRAALRRCGPAFP